MNQKKQSSINSIDIVGIGNAIVDVLVQVKDSFLISHSMRKGSMKLINEDEAKNLYSKIKDGHKISGGSAANTIAGISQLGGKAAFIGRVRDDILGETFTKEIHSKGAIFNTKHRKSGPSTGRCLIFITPDAQRTMCTYLGASTFLEPEDLDLSLVTKSKILYLEGYLWDNNSAKKAFIRASEAAKESGGKVALSLSDSFCVERHRESFLDLINNHIDLLFANESEIVSLYQAPNLESSLNLLSNQCKTAAITLGEQGSILINKGERIKIDPYKFGPTIDTTGAGDLYAGGFLYGLSKGIDAKRCGQIGSICAGQIVTEIGPRTNAPIKELIELHL
tara:strand:- start:125 stop:1132 length:1008 start_codon:yes stop_codon:yes gene_type:complete